MVAEILNRGKGTGGWIGWAVFLYTFLANSLFLVSWRIGGEGGVNDEMMGVWDPQH